MKGIANILLYSFFLLTFTPATVMATTAVLSACEIKCCIDENETCELIDLSCCSKGTCNPAQCVFCGLMCSSEVNKIEVVVYNDHIKLNAAEKQLLPRDHPSKPWQPPKTATV